MPITLEELARKINLSASTISRVVNNKAYVNPETRKLVLKALKESGYLPNQAARSLKNKSTATIAVIVPDISEDFFAHVFKGIDAALGGSGYSLILCDTGEDPKREEQFLSMMAQKQVDGIILATVSKDCPTLRSMLTGGTNIVFFDNLPKIDLNLNSVMTDNAKASEMVVAHLAGLGHRNIGIIAGKQDETTGFERFAGYRKAIADLNLNSDDSLVAFGDFKENSGYECMKALLGRNKSMTAVYATSSKMTFGAIKAIAESDRQIPGDIALVGFDVHDPSGLIEPGITAIMQNEARIGSIAAEILLKMIRQPEAAVNTRILLEPSLIVRESSCGKQLGIYG